MIDALVILAVTIFVLLFVDLNMHRKKILKKIEEINEGSSRQKRGSEHASYS